MKNFLSPTDYGPWINDVSDAVQEINALCFFDKKPGFLKMHFAYFKYSPKTNEIKEIQLCMPLYKCDLHQWIKIQDTDDAKNFKNLASMVVQLAKGLDHIHKAGFMHRDIKTLNILVANDERTVVWSDFGAALFLFNGSAHEQRMRDGATYWWRSPENLIQEGKKPYETSTASDIWSFGVCVVEMIIGKIPFEVDDHIFDLQLSQCSFALSSSMKDEFGIIEICVKKNLPIDDSEKSKLRKNVYSSLRNNKLSNSNAKKVANFVFDRLIHLLPSRRASAQHVVEFFSEFN